MARAIDKQVVNVDDVEEVEYLQGQHWGGAYKPLTPGMGKDGVRLGVNVSCLPSGRAACPFHWHQSEDEAFYVLSGRGVLRYGDDVREIRAGDCISCPAGTQVGHQIANPFDEDLVYLGIGVNDPHEVGVYPDTGKIMVRSLERVGWLESVDYMQGEQDEPKIFKMVDDAGLR